jgi:streptogramin lyase
LADKIGMLTTDGTFAEFDVSPGTSPTGITAGPDGNLWFTEYGIGGHAGSWTGNGIGKITPLGIVTEYPLPNSVRGPWDITAGSDGNLWFTGYAYRIGRITILGLINIFELTDPYAIPRGIAAGPDGNIWFTENGGSRIGRITPGAIVPELGPPTITEFDLPRSNSYPWGIAAGPNGNLWFTETDRNQIGQITTDGAITEFGALPTPQSGPSGIVAGPDWNVWFTEANADSIGQITTN